MNCERESRKTPSTCDLTQRRAWEELYQHVNAYFTQTGNEVAVIGATCNSTHNFYEFFVEGSSLMKHAVSQKLSNIEVMLKFGHTSNGEQQISRKITNRIDDVSTLSLADIKTETSFEPNQATSIEGGRESLTNNSNCLENRNKVLIEVNEVSQESVDFSKDDRLTSGLDTEPGLNMSVSYEETESNYKTEDSESPDEESAMKKGRYSCLYCNESFRTYALCQVHLKSNTCGNQKFKCKNELKDNCKSRKKVPKYLIFDCKVCGQVCATKEQLKEHKALHKVPKYLIFDCKVCGQVCATKEQLKEHKALHKVPKACFCTLCNQGFSNEQRLVIHMRTIHGNESKTHMCHICGHKFKTKRSVNEHVKRAHIRDHACDKCGKYYGSAAQLKTHSRTHVGSRPHICDVCGKDFSQPAYLTVHMRTHTGEKPFSCQECGKSFTSISCLNIHLRVHTGEKPHACAVCNKMFRRLGDMKRHIRRHSGEKPYPCQHCDKHFADSKSRKRHIQVSCTKRNCSE